MIWETKTFYEYGSTWQDVTVIEQIHVFSGHFLTEPGGLRKVPILYSQSDQSHALSEEHLLMYKVLIRSKKKKKKIQTLQFRMLFKK